VDGDNGVRIWVDEVDNRGVSAGPAPAVCSIAVEAAVALVGGNALAQTVFLPIPQVEADALEAGVNYFPDLPKSFNTGTGFTECFAPFTPEELLGQSPDNT